MYIAIMGYGVVGSGTAEVLRMNNERICKASCQEKMELKYILDLRTFPGDINEKLVVSDFNIILNDKDVGIVVETMGGLHPAYEFVSACLKAGKSVVTSNKELVAEKGYELLETAKENNVNFMFEASVGGGIPVIRPITRCLAANKITEVAGILNGTTNYILTKMITEGKTFDDALAVAQQLGYAEKNPTADVDGIDACRKICILAALCFGKHVLPGDVYTEGIRGITAADVEYAKAWGGVIKLIATAKYVNDDKNITAVVSPAFVKNGSQLAGIDDVFNGVLVRGNAVDETVFYGRGAGKLPTASAVVADVVDCALHTEKRKPFGWEKEEKDFVIPADEFVSAYFVRMKGDDAEAEKLFGKVDFVKYEAADKSETAFVTGEMTFGELKAILAKAGDKAESVIRITDY